MDAILPERQHAIRSGDQNFEIFSGHRKGSDHEKQTHTARRSSELRFQLILTL
jgi:hypothetical protein